MSRAKKGAIITAILILLYGVFGFLIAPYIIKSNLISGIAGQLGRNVTVNEVKVNPFVLSVTVRGFEMSEPDGEFKLNEFRLSEKGIDDTLISVPCFSVKGVHIDLSNKKSMCFR